MQHSRSLSQPHARAEAQPLPRPGALPRHARLFEMIRQQELSVRALERLHHRTVAEQGMALPSPAALAETLYDRSAAVSG